MQRENPICQLIDSNRAKHRYVKVEKYGKQFSVAPLRSRKLRYRAISATSEKPTHPWFERETARSRLVVVRKLEPSLARKRAIFTVGHWGAPKRGRRKTIFLASTKCVPHATGSTAARVVHGALRVVRVWVFG